MQRTSSSPSRGGKKNLSIPLDTFLQKASGHSFFDTSEFNFAKLVDDPTNIKANILAYIENFPENAPDISARFAFYKSLEKLDNSGLPRISASTTMTATTT
jgi:type I restriction enzyme M protein